MPAPVVPFHVRCVGLNAILDERVQLREAVGPKEDLLSLDEEESLRVLLGPGPAPAGTRTTKEKAGTARAGLMIIGCKSRRSGTGSHSRRRRLLEAGRSRGGAARTIVPGRLRRIKMFLPHRGGKRRKAGELINDDLFLDLRWTACDGHPARGVEFACRILHVKYTFTSLFHEQVERPTTIFQIRAFRCMLVPLLYFALWCLCWILSF